MRFLIDVVPGTLRDYPSGTALMSISLYIIEMLLKSLKHFGVILLLQSTWFTSQQSFFVVLNRLRNIVCSQKCGLVAFGMQHR
jgi:hypothetical protein